MNHKQNSSSGLNLLIKDVKGFSQAQSAWRFYNNENVDIQSLNNSILTKGIDEINKICDKYLLIAYDWSHLDYRGHESKKDCIETKRSVKGERKSKGYDFQSSLAISDRGGEPIAPLIQNLKTNTQVYSTYDDSIPMTLTHIEELNQRSEYVHQHLNIEKKIVDIIDREGDSVALYRAYAKSGRSFIVRAQDRSGIVCNGRAIAQASLAKEMELGEYLQTIIYQKGKVDIYVNEVDITITRDASCKDPTGAKKQIKIKGDPVKARFVVTRLVNEKQEIVATWMLVSNLNQEVSARTIATWYYYRWKIETYFKLLKSSGFNLESWQQKNPLALFKRLLVVSYACIIVWQIEHDNSEKMKKHKEFLVKLSGRLIQRGKEATSSALLAGLWSFFSMLDIFETHDMHELYSIRETLTDLMEIPL